ncbi:COG1470 family protein [Streptomyces sp. NPDC002309]
MSCPTRAVHAVCLSLLALLCTAPAARAAGEGWSVAPAGGGRPSFYAEGAPGTALRDTVSVTNRTRHPVIVRLTGTGVPVTFADAEIRVPARTRADVSFTVAVPEGAAPGDRTGTIAVRDGDGGARSVPLLLRIGGPELSALTVERVAVRGDRITYDLVNRGTTDLVPTLSVRADGVLGTLLDRAPRTLPVELAPGRRLRLSEPWADRPALDAVEVRLTVTAAGGARDTARTSAGFVPRGPVAAGTAALVLGVAALAVVLRRRRRAAPEPAPERVCEPIELTGVAR